MYRTVSDDAEIDGLAAEYVLGSLMPAERLAVTQRLRTDQALAKAVTAWQRLLTPLSLHEPGLAPPPHAVERVLAEITRQTVKDQKSRGVVALRRANRWRVATASLAAASVVLAIVLGTLIANQPTSTSPLIAVLAKGPDSTTADEPTVSTNPVFLATSDPVTESLTIRQISGRRPAAERSYAMWLTALGGAQMTFVGLLSKTEPATRFHFSQATPDASKNGTLAISLESGSSVQAPTGPFLSIGKLEPAAR